MVAVKIVFWSLFFIIFYSYIGYGILLFILIRIRRLFRPMESDESSEDYEPE